MRKSGKRGAVTALVLAVALAVSLLGGLVGGFAGLSAEPEAPGQAAASGVGIQYGFRSEKLLESHYEKHGAEFGDITREEYLLLANALIASPTALRKAEKEDGDTVIYEEASNQFLVLSTDGYIRSFFRPDDGLAYYERQ